MTIQEFRDEIQSWYDYIVFCDDNGFYDRTDSIYSAESAERYVDDSIGDMTRSNTWEEVRDYLNSLPDHFGDGEYYRLSDYDEFEILGSYELQEEIDDFLDCHKDFFEVEEEILEVSSVLV